MARKPAPKNNRVYVGNLVTSITKEELVERFSTCGEIKHIWVAHNPPGFAFVEYYTQKDAENSIRNLDGLYFNGNKIRVQLSHTGARNHHHQRRPSEDYINNNKPNSTRLQRNYQRNDIQRFRNQRSLPQSTMSPGNLRRGDLRRRLGPIRDPDPQLRYDDWEYDEIGRPYYDDEMDYRPSKRSRMMTSRSPRRDTYLGPPSPNGSESPTYLPPRRWKNPGSPEQGYRQCDLNSTFHKLNPPIRRNISSTTVYTAEQLMKTRKRLKRMAPKSGSTGLSPHSSTDRGTVFRRNIEDNPVQRLKNSQYIEDFDRDWSPVPSRRRYSPGVSTLKRKKVPLSNQGSIKHSPERYDYYPSGGGKYTDSFESDYSYDAAPPRRKSLGTASIKSSKSRALSDGSQYPTKAPLKRHMSPECVMCSSGAPKPRFTRPQSPNDLPPIKVKRKTKSSHKVAVKPNSKKVQKRALNSPCRSEASSAYSSSYSINSRSHRSQSPKRAAKKRPMTPPIFSRSPTPPPVVHKKKSKKNNKIRRKSSEQEREDMSPPFSRDRVPYTPSPERPPSPEPKKKIALNTSPARNNTLPSKKLHKMPKSRHVKDLSPLPPIKMKNNSMNRKLPKAYLSEFSPERISPPKHDRNLSPSIKVKKLKKLRSPVHSPSRSPSPFSIMAKKTHHAKLSRKARSPSMSESQRDSFYSSESEANLSPRAEEPAPMKRKRKKKKLGMETMTNKSRLLKKRRKSWSSESRD